MASNGIKCAPVHRQEGHVIFGMSLFCCPVFRGEAFGPQGGAPTDKSDAVRHFVVGSLCRNQRGSVAALPPPASKEVSYEQN